MAPATQTGRSSVQARFDAKFQAFISDPGFVSGEANLDKEAVQKDFLGVRASYSEFMNFYVYRRHLRALKAQNGALPAGVEQSLGERSGEAIAAYREATNGLERISQRLDNAGVSDAFNRHVPLLLADLDKNPKTPGIMEEFRSMGVPEGSIGWLYNKLGENKYDAFRFDGMDGTFAGVVERSKSHIPGLERDAALLVQHGIPTLEGAGSDADTYTAAGVTVAIAIIVGIVSAW